MYLYAFAIFVLGRVVVQTLGLDPWAALLRLEPLQQLAAQGDAGRAATQFMVTCAVYCCAFVLLSLAISVVGTLRDDPALLERVSREPAWWANVARRDLIWCGTRPYAWAALGLPTVVLIAVSYRIAHDQQLPNNSFGDMLALVLLAGIGAAQVLMPFRWGRKLLPALPRLAQRIGSASTQRAPEAPPGRPRPAGPTGVQREEFEEWNDHLVLVPPGRGVA